MLRHGRAFIVVLIALAILGCQHAPPKLDIPNVPAIDYGRPGEVTR